MNIEMKKRATDKINWYFNNRKCINETDESLIWSIKGNWLLKYCLNRFFRTFGSPLTRWIAFRSHEPHCLSFRPLSFSFIQSEQKTEIWIQKIRNSKVKWYFPFVYCILLQFKVYLQCCLAFFCWYPLNVLTFFISIDRSAYNQQCVIYKFITTTQFMQKFQIAHS